MAEEIFSQSWLESGTRQIFSPEEEKLFSNLDLSLSIGYNSATNPFKDQSHPLFSSQDSNIVNPISTSSAAGNKTETISNFSQDVLNGTRNENNNNQVEPIRDEISRVNSIEDPNMHDKNNKMKEIKSQKRRCRNDTLSKETISQYFYMPIDEAYKELNVGKDRLKKRCRLLGISRWPYLKFRTLKTLETKIKEIWEMDGQMDKSELKNILESLEMERARIENDPNLEFGDNIEKLKAIYL